MQIKDIIALDDKYYMGVFGKRFPICFVDGKGSSLIDSQDVYKRQDKPNILVAEFSRPIRIERGNINAIEKILPGCRPVQTSQYIHEGRFPAA